jgi:hypothetical protein
MAISVVKLCLLSILIPSYGFTKEKFTYLRFELLHLFYTEVLILDQKNLKIEHEIACHNKEEKALSRSIAALSNKLLSLNLQLCERKDYKETLDKENLYTQNHYMNVLKVHLSFKVIQNPLLACCPYQSFIRTK